MKANLISVLTAYLTLVAVAYSFGYWDEFNIKVLEHAGVRDLFGFAIHGLFVLFIGLVGGGFIGLIAKAYTEVFSKNRDPSPEPEEIKNGKEKPLNIPLEAKKILGVSAFLLVAIGISFFFEFQFKWFMVAYVLLFSIAMAPIEYHPLYKRLFSEQTNPVAIASMLAVMVSLPVAAYGFGAQEAAKIKHGESSRKVVLNEHSNNDSLVIIGVLSNEYFFFNEKDNTVKVLSRGSVSGMNISLEDEVEDSADQ